MRESIKLALILLLSCGAFAKSKILVFSKTAGFYHKSIPAGVQALLELGRQNNLEVDSTTDAEKFTSDNLKQYNAIVFLNTTGDVLNDLQQQAFRNYIQSGGGFVGVHAATDMEYNWPWYNQLVGAYFNGHPKIQEAELHITDSTHSATKHLPTAWKRSDEWYNFKSIVEGLKVLIKIDESTYSGGTNGKDHIMSWYHEFDGGRSFYTALGHTDESYSDPLFLKHLLGGIEYAIEKRNLK